MSIEFGDFFENMVNCGRFWYLAQETIQIVLGDEGDLLVHQEGGRVGDGADREDRARANPDLWNLR
jgi:hypothetical protein